MADILQELISKLSMDADDFTRGIDKAVGSSEGFDKWMGKIADTIMSPAGVVGALAAIGTASFSAAQMFDEVSDTIQTKTGATGAALAQLENSFKAVFANVPADAEMVTSAIADLNARLGITGKPLEDLATQFVNLARITKTDVSSSIQSATRVFGDWNIETSKQSSTLDYLFRVSQHTGAGITSLSDNIVKFGAPLRQMGFDFETSAALLGKFEAEGVNTELVMGSLRIALTRMAKEGIEDPKQALEALVERIKSAGSAGEANKIALEAFGAKAGPDMAAAIREGRFSIEELVSDLQSSKSTINDTAEATDDFGEKWSKTWHSIQMILVPIGNAIRFVLDQIVEEIKAFVTMFQYLGEKAGWVGDKIMALTDKLGLTKVQHVQAKEATDKLTEATAKLAPSIEKTGAALVSSAEKTKSLKEQQAALKAEMDRLDEAQKRDYANLVNAKTAGDKWRQALIDENAELQKQWKELDAIVLSAAAATVDMSAFAATKDLIDDLTPNLIDVNAELGKIPGSLQMSTLDISTLKSAAEAATTGPGGIKEKFGEFDREVSTIVTNMTQGITDSLWSGEFSWKEKGLAALTDLGKAATSLFIQPFTDAIAKFIAGALTDLLSGKGLGGILDKLKGIGDAVGSVFGGGAGAATGAAGTAAGGATSAGGSIAGAAGGSIATWMTAISGAVSAVTGIIGIFQTSNTNDRLWQIEENTRYTKGYFETALDRIDRWWPNLEYLWTGMQRIEQETFKLFDIADLLTNIRDDARANLYPQMAMAGGRSITIPVSVTLDGRVVAESVVTYLEESGTRLP